MHDTVSCGSCQRQMVPQLFIRRRSFATPLVQHLCPFCGTAHLRSGGDFKLWFVVATLILFPPSLLLWIPYGLWRLYHRLT